MTITKVAGGWDVTYTVSEADVNDVNAPKAKEIFWSVSRQNQEYINTENEADDAVTRKAAIDTAVAAQVVIPTS